MSLQGAGHLISPLAMKFEIFVVGPAVTVRLKRRHTASRTQRLSQLGDGRKLLHRLREFIVRRGEICGKFEAADRDVRTLQKANSIFTTPRLDLLQEIPPELSEQLVELLPKDDRRETLRLQAYPEDTAGAVMTTEVVKLSESLSVSDALEELRRRAPEVTGASDGSASGSASDPDPEGAS